MATSLSKGSRFWLLVILAALIFGAVSWTLVRNERRLQAESLRPDFDLQAHRGGRGLLPENTLPAFAHAVALGVTTLELDIGVTKDGIVVVHHDRRLSPERTRGPDGVWIAEPGPLLRNLTFDELQQAEVGRVRPGSRTAERFPEQRSLDGVRVPSLKAVIEQGEAQAPGRLFYNVETKISPLAPEETASPEDMAAAVVHVLAETGVLSRATLQSFDWRTLAVAARLAPGLTRVFLSAERDWLDNVGRGAAETPPWAAGNDVDAHGGSLPKTIRAAGGEIWSPFFRDLTAAELKEAQALGLRVIVWTVNEAADMERLIGLGVDGIITDYPDRLRAVMAKRGLALPPPFAAP